MINEYQSLRIYAEQLEERIKKLEIKPEIFKEIKQYEDIKFFPLLKIDNLILKYMETTTALEPTILANQIILWKDTTLTKYYLKTNLNGTSKKIELL